MKPRVLFSKSLLVRYMLIVFAALVIWPIIFPLASTLYQLTIDYSNEAKLKKNIYAGGDRLENRWHEEAAALKDAKEAAIAQRLRDLKREFPKAGLFWVDQTGRTRLMLPERPGIPQQWNAGDSIAFMKQSFNGDPFTAVAFIGQQPEQGFIVIQVPRKLMVSDASFDSAHIFIIVIAVFVLFTASSWWFFYRLRSRLVRLEEAMTSPDGSGIPAPVEVRSSDEIGQLEHAFNRMIGELQLSRQREREEEELRKKLIANLSHDLRTPLTTIRGHAHSLRQEPVSDRGKQSLTLIDTKVGDLAQLIDNLLSYTLLSAKKYEFHPEQTDILRLVRTSAAGWFPVWEKEGFEVNIDLPEHPLTWEVDPQWFARILDNLFQNVLRHAASGRYIGVRTEMRAGREALVIEDRGPGMEAVSQGKGAGIGLTIVALMTQDMRLHWEVASSSEGTVTFLYPKLNWN
ncbi:histidine kinase dimerization/phospho-acceptor domain-containing protein [Paenibacillus apiarius]|uniref:sensor histidine kinase n=1 Tax=Paenibacillus apiarius TaxID=46240 RepID=UPI003B3BAEF9